MTLWPLALVSIAAALACGLRWRKVAPGPLRSLAEALPAGSLALLAVLAGAPFALAAALALGAAGDAALTRPGTRAFVAGAGSIAAGHVALVVLFLSDGGGLAALAGLRLAAACTVLAAAIGFGLWLLPRCGEVARPTGLAIAVVALTGVAAATLPLARWPAMLGAWGLMEAAGALAVGTFVMAPDHPAQRSVARAVWWTRYLAQGAIAWAWIGP